MVVEALSGLLKPYRGMKRDIYIIFISKTVNAMGALIFPFMTLLLSRKIGLDAADTGFYVAITGMLYGPASLVGGKLSDSFGRKPVLISGEAFAAAAYLLCVFMEPGMPMVYVLMAASFCFGLAGPSHDALTADLTEKDQRQGAFSLNYLGFNMGFAFAQVLAGLLFENYLHLMFLIDALTAIAGFMLIALFVKEPARSDTAGDENEAEEEDRFRGKSVLYVIAKKPVLLIFALSIFGYRFLYSQWPFLIPLQLEHHFPGEGAAHFGVLGSFNALIVVICTPLLTAIFRKIGPVRRIVYAGLLFAVGFGLLGFFSFKTAFFIAVGIFTLGEIMEAISVMPFLMNHAPAGHRGRIGSVMPILMGAGFTLGPIVMGPVLDARGFPFSWGIAVGVGVLATLVMLGIDLNDRRPSE